MTQEYKEVSLEDALNIASMHMQAGNYRVAEMTYRDILKAIPDHFFSLYYLGLAMYYLSNLPESLKYLEQAANSNEATAEFWCNLGIIRQAAGNHDGAQEAFNRSIAMDDKGSYADPHWNKAHSLWLAGKYDEAEKCARKATEINPASPEAWLNLGTALVKLDRLEDAAASWEKALEIRPDYAFAWSNLGSVLRDMGKLSDSEEACRKALELQPQYPEAICNLGNALLDQGQITSAEELYRSAIALKPDYAQAHNNLCVCLIRQSRFDEAVLHARYATSFDKNYAEAFINLSDALRHLGKIEEAITAIQQAANLNPESAEVHMDLADALFMQDHYGDAEVELQRAKELEPDSPRVFLKLANVLERGNKIDEALEAIDKAVELNPEMPEAYLRKAQICHISNRIEEAEKCLNKALELRPDMPGIYVTLAELQQTKGDMNASLASVKKAFEITKHIPGAYLTLSKLKKFTADDEDFKTMLELEKTIESRGLDQATSLNFALYSAYENIGDYKQAFAHLKKANDYKRQMIPFQPEQQKNHYQKIKDAYTPETLKKFEGKGYDSDIPVFIVGMPRSGTTLTEQIISSHPDVFGAGELPTLGQTEAHLGGLTTENAAQKGQLYVDEIKKLDPSGKALRITDKMPGNFSKIGLIACILPHAKIIHCRRDPIDNCLSCYKQNFARGQYWSYNLEELAEQHLLYQDIMDHWRKVLPGRFLEIDYEETVGNFEEQARKLIDFVDLPWNDACLEPHKQKRAVLTASKTQVVKPIYKTSVKAWQRYEDELQPLIQGLAAGKKA
ncbi:MAG: tetratricopeptide repeat protein [Rhodospirillales bacterium]|nr:tetratricopeptide repeat protein [Rhodospirillales bacterium]